MKNDGNAKLQNEAEMEELENMIFKKTVEVNDQIRTVIKSLCDVYKEFRKNGVNASEAIALMGILFGGTKGGSR